MPDINLAGYNKIASKTDDRPRNADGTLIPSKSIVSAYSHPTTEAAKQAANPVTYPEYGFNK